MKIKKFKHPLLIFEVIMSLFVIGTIIFIIILLRDDENSDNLYNLQRNWIESAIVDIKAVENNQTCPDIFENILSPLTYPGMVNSCECNGTEIQDTKGSLCSFKQIYSGCRNIYSKKELLMSSYKNKKLCVRRRNEGYKQIRKYIRNSTDDCPEKEVKCGVADTMNNKLCMKEEECPITEIIFTNRNETQYQNYSIVILNEIIKDDEYEDTYLFFSNKNIGRIYSNVILSSRNSVCMNSDFNTYSTFNDCKFTFFKNQTNICSAYDESFVKLDKISGYQLYQENGILNNYFDQTDACKKNFDEKYLFTSYYHGLNTTCSQDKTDMFIDIVLSRYSIRGNILAYLEIFLYLVVILYVFLCIGLKWYLLTTQDFKKLPQIHKIDLLFSLILFILSFYLLTQFFLLRKETEFVEYFKLNYCGDDSVNNLACQLYDYNEKTIRTLFFSFIFILIGSFIYLIKMCYLTVLIKNQSNVTEIILKDMETTSNPNDSINKTFS